MEKLNLNLVSTALVPNWGKKGHLNCIPLSIPEFIDVIKNSNSVKNYCGHPETIKSLKNVGLDIPDQLLQYDSEGIVKKNFKGEPQGAFWDGVGIAIAARPIGGVRSVASTGDTLIDSLTNLEFLMFEFVEAV